MHALRSTPFGDELTLAFVSTLLAREPLGQDAVPDLLALSLSSTDYIGHAFGPESREAEDNLLRPRPHPGGAVRAAGQARG